MYTLSITRDFTAQHFLVGGDWGPENDLHSHDYRLELRIQGVALDAHGYLLDIVDLEAQLEALIARYRGQTLNSLPEFEGLNPSIEHFARLICMALASHLEAPNLKQIEVRVWEDDIAWASYQNPL